MIKRDYKLWPSGRRMSPSDRCTFLEVISIRNIFYLFIHLPVYSPTPHICSSTHQNSHPSIIQLLIHPPIHLCTLIHPSTQPASHPPTRLFIHPSTYISCCPPIHVRLYTPIHLFNVYCVPVMCWGLCEMPRILSEQKHSPFLCSCSSLFTGPGRPYIITLSRGDPWKLNLESRKGNEHGSVNLDLDWRSGKASLRRWHWDGDLKEEQG